MEYRLLLRDWQGLRKLSTLAVSIARFTGISQKYKTLIRYDRLFAWTRNRSVCLPFTGLSVDLT